MKGKSYILYTPLRVLLFYEYNILGSNFNIFGSTSVFVLPVLLLCFSAICKPSASSWFVMQVSNRYAVSVVLEQLFYM